MTVVPNNIKLYHIVHIDRLPSILSEGSLLCDAAVRQRSLPGTMIGMSQIKERRLNATLSSCPGLHVGDCVPFYFCSRSVMLYVISRRNSSDITYHGGQENIVHFVFDLNQVVDWAQKKDRRFAFTTSNAGSYYFIDYNDLSSLNQIDWDAVNSTQWQQCKDNKQAEFLLEQSISLELLESIGVYSDRLKSQVEAAFYEARRPIPNCSVCRDWYY